MTCRAKNSKPLLVQGSIVYAKSGRDAGSFYVVLSVDQKFAMIADGRRRTCQTPKRKNKKHLYNTKKVLCEQQLTTNKQIRHMLWQWNFGCNVEYELEG